MWHRFNGYVEKERLFAGCGKLLLAVSGGVDSVVLLHLTVRYARENPPLELGIAHCNFHLRGEESLRDEAFVRRLASAYGIPLFTTSFDTGAYAARHGVSIEMAARELRYGYFSELMRVQGFDACLLAHHADDNAETFFINLFRGSGVKGLRGMLPCGGENARYLRPLLFARRKEIVCYAAGQALDFVEDSTNDEEVYLRNKIRHSVLPVLERCSPGFTEKLVQSMASLRLADSLLDDWYAEAEKQLVRKVRGEGKGAVWLKNLVGKDLEVKSEEFISVRSLSALPKQELFWELYLRRRGFSRRQSAQIQDNAQNGQAGKLFFNTDGTAFLLREAEGWRCFFLEKDMRRQTVSVQAPVYEEGLREITSPQEVYSDADTVYLAYEKLQFPLVWRHWQAGDRFIPLGMHGFKKLSDFFTDLRLGRGEKDEVWLLCSGADIVWVAGFRMDNRYRIDLSDLPRKAWVVKLKKA